MKRQMFLIIAWFCVLTVIAGTRIYKSQQNKCVNNDTEANMAAYEETCMAFACLDFEIEQALNNEDLTFDYTSISNQIALLHEQADESLRNGTISHDFDNLLAQMDVITASL